jgi:hypothetical protein
MHNLHKREYKDRRKYFRSYIKETIILIENSYLMSTLEPFSKSWGFFLPREYHKLKKPKGLEPHFPLSFAPRLSVRQLNLGFPTQADIWVLEIWREGKWSTGTVDIWGVRETKETISKLQQVYLVCVSCNI